MEEIQRTLETHALRALAEGEVDAEFQVLDTLTKAVLLGSEVGADFQEVANLVMAKSLVRGKLPSQKQGRRKGRSGVDGRVIAKQYIELRAGGASYESAVAQLASTYHKDERQITRIVQANRKVVESMEMLSEVSKIGPELSEVFAELEKAWEATISHRFEDSDEAAEVVIGDIDRRQRVILQRRFGTDIK
jgi:hypothetical protein